MDSENIYEHRLNTRSGAYPMRYSQKVRDVNKPGPSQSELYNISSNYNIFPRKERDYDNIHINRQRSADTGADPRQPVAIPVNERLNYSTFIERQSIPLTKTYNKKDSININPLAKLSQTFNNFATTSEPQVVPEMILQEYPFVHPEEESIEQNLPPPDSRPPIDDETREHPFAEPDYRVGLEKNIIGNQRMGSYAYPQVYRDRPFMQLPQMNLILNPKPLYLHVDSSHRNRDRFPNPADYVFPLVSASDDVDTPGERYKDICEISLVSATIPNNTGVLDKPYLVLQIDEIGGHYDGVGIGCRKAFSKLYFDNPGGKFLRVDKGIGDPAVRVFYPKPLASLSRLSISIRNPDGTIFNFGTDTSLPQAPNPDLQNTFTFQIITKIVDINKAIGHRNP